MKVLLTNCKVWLGKKKFAEAVGFDSDSGLIEFTGTVDEAKNHKSNFDEIIDLKQRLVLPAFTDGHCHFVLGAYVNSQLNLRDASTKSDFKKRILEFKNKNGSKWIQGGFFTDTNFKEQINLSKEFFDEISEDVPMIVSRFDTHSAYANTKAIELSGLNDHIDDFTTEELPRDEKNIITGEIKERAIHFVQSAIPKPSMNDRESAVLNLMKEFHSYGITSISDITLTEDLDVYKSLLESKKLSLHIDARLPFREYNNLKKYSKDFSFTDLIKFHSLKAFYDGSLSSRTAYMHDNYKNASYNGIRTEFVNSGEFEKLFNEIDKAGYQMSVHAIGDKAVTELLDMNEELIKRNGHKGRRFRIEHAQHIQGNDFERFKKLNVIASVQPTHLFSDALTAKEILSDITIEHNYKKLFELNAHVCFGTDFPIVSENPFETIFYAMTRKANGFQDGFVNENKIPLEDCLFAYTEENSFASFNENRSGKIASGQYADLCIMEDNLFEMNESEIKGAKVYQTYFGGVRVF